MNETNILISYCLPFTGFLIDITGTSETVFYAFGAVHILGGITFFLVGILTIHLRKRRGSFDIEVRVNANKAREDVSKICRNGLEVTAHRLTIEQTGSLSSLQMIGAKAKGSEINSDGLVLSCTKLLDNTNKHLQISATNFSINTDPQ